MGITYAYTAIKPKVLKKHLKLVAKEKWDAAYEVIHKNEQADFFGDKGFGVVYSEIWNRKGPEWLAVRLAFFGPPSRNQGDESAYLEAAEVREAAKGLRALSLPDVEAFSRKEVASFYRPGPEGDKAREEHVRQCMVDVQNLQKFYDEAAARGDAVFIGVG
jgi:hypothetical protein